ncbi:unnamed protein product, partial [Ixodes pacificus]
AGFVRWAPSSSCSSGPCPCRPPPPGRAPPAPAALCPWPLPRTPTGSSWGPSRTWTPPRPRRPPCRLKLPCPPHSSRSPSRSAGPPRSRCGRPACRPARSSSAAARPPTWMKRKSPSTRRPPRRGTTGPRLRRKRRRRTPACLTQSTSSALRLFVNAPVHTDARSSVLCRADLPRENASRTSTPTVVFFSLFLSCHFSRGSRSQTRQVDPRRCPPIEGGKPFSSVEGCERVRGDAPERGEGGRRERDRN